jgi:hypothetical protein
MIDTVSAIIEKVFLGAVGGLVAFFIAKKQFVSQRWWDKRFDLYSDILDTLRLIEHSLAIFEEMLPAANDSKKEIVVKSAVSNFEDSLSKLHGLQNKMLMLGLDKTHHKLLALRAALMAIDPRLICSYEQTREQEVLNLVKQSKRLVGGACGEVSFLGQADLELKGSWKTIADAIVKIKSRLKDAKNSRC